MEMNFNQGLKYLTDPRNARTPAKQPDSSNTGPAAAWRKVVDAQAADRRGGEPTVQPFHTPKGTETAQQAWLRAIKPAA